MTTIQAGLSTGLSLLVGIALAWALDRVHFPARGLLVALFASAIVTPGLVVAFGLLAVWGRSGWISAWTVSAFGAPLEVPLFGLGGILAAHVILDAAFAARILLTRLEALPRDRLKTGQSLGLTAWQRFVVIDWPALRGTLPGLAAIIFLLAFTSFPIVLLLGGGPSNQTLEVAIYSAVRLDFDLESAVRLALVQIAVCLVVIVAAASFPVLRLGSGEPRAQRWKDGAVARGIQCAVLAIATLAFALPLLAVLAGSAAVGPLLSRSSFWLALGASIGIATASSLLTLAIVLILALGRAAAPGPVSRLLLGTPAYAYLAVPAVVLALGFFLLVRAMGISTEQAGPAVVIIANALLALPFAVALLGPALEALTRQRGKLIRALGLSGIQQFRLVELPLIRADIGVVLALAFCFSFGDLGVIALFGTENFATLPLLMQRALGAYRGNDAVAIAAVMLAITILAFAGLPRLLGGARRAAA